MSSRRAALTYTRQQPEFEAFAESAQVLDVIEPRGLAKVGTDTIYQRTSHGRIPFMANRC